MDLYLLKDFNNYFNRKVIRLSMLQDYLDSVEEDGYFVVENTNFNPNDGISTSHIIGSANHPFNKEWQPDYALLVEWLDGGQPKIVSRWFVTESARTMANQYTVALKRDSVVDRYDKVLIAPTYIEKAPVRDTDPFIVNNEGIQFNQIKTKEYFIKDETKIPWIVAYLNQNKRPYTEINAVYSSSTVEVLEDHPDIMTFLGIDPSHVVATLKNDLVFNDNVTFYFRFGNYWVDGIINHYTARSYTINANKTTNSKNLIVEGSTVGLPSTDLNLLYYTSQTIVFISKMEEIAQRLANAISNHFNDFVQPYYNESGCSYHSSNYTVPEWAYRYNGQTFYSRTANRYFTLYLEAKDPEEQKSSNTQNLSFVQQYQGDITGYQLRNNANPKAYRVDYSTKRYSYSLSDTDGASIRLNLLGTDPTDTQHAQAFQSKIQPYDVICFPATDITIIDEDGNELECLGDSGYNIARALSSQLGAGEAPEVYDVQIMPFCPARELLNDDGMIDLRKCGNNQALPVFQTTDNRVVSYCLFCTMPWSEFSTNVVYTHFYHSAPSIPISEALALTDRKIQANCDMWRLCSPNFASAFEFNVAKCYPLDPSQQGSFLTTFNIDVCFRPQNPYIHVNPNFGFLYGQDFNDARGLICSGDFSLTILSNAWTNYQIQNKNFQNIFDRQIENMETNRSIAREQEQWNITQAGIGIGFAGAAGVGIGVGNAIGAISDPAALLGGLGALGGIAKSGLGLGTAIKKSQWAERAYQEQRSFATDMFNMQMDNIKALPNSITHTSSITNNYKFFPMLEYYTCTEQEKEALRNKMKYNGMTLGRIDRIENFIKEDDEAFIKGQIVRLDDISDDAHLAKDIYDEVNKGLFFIPQSEIERRKKAINYKEVK